MSRTFSKTDAGQAALREPVSDRMIHGAPVSKKSKQRESKTARRINPSIHQSTNPP